MYRQTSSDWKVFALLIVVKAYKCPSGIMRKNVPSISPLSVALLICQASLLYHVLEIQKKKTKGKMQLIVTEIQQCMFLWFPWLRNMNIAALLWTLSLREHSNCALTRGYIYVHPTGGWTYYFCFFRRPASHLVSRHFRQQFLSYLYQIWHAGYWVNSLYGIAFGDDSSIANWVIATLLLLSSSLVSRHFKECY